LAGFARLVGCDDVVSARIDTGTGQVLALDNPPVEHGTDSLAWACPLVVGQHPGFIAYRSGRLPRGASVALTDLVETRAFRRTPLYSEVFRPRGIADDLLCSVALDSRQDIVLTLSRTTHGFSQRDRALVGLIAPHLAQYAAWRQRASVARPRPERPVPALDLLTAREQQVSTHVLRGATDREIARALTISTRTVHKHLERIYRKLDLTNRTSLIALLTAQAEQAGGQL
jgi:DNA-binding CsgD family transcriptional regulator